MTPHRGATVAHVEDADLRISHISLPKVGELANGDRAFYRADEQRRILLAIIDGLGHGPEAAKVSQAAVEKLEQLSLTAPVLEIMETVHLHIRGTRGAAATVCLIRDGKISACGVGNVELRSSETQIPFVFSPGILGVRVQKFRVCETLIRAGTRLVMFSDGISTRLGLEKVRALPPREACATIIEHHRKAEDDATVLVADIG